MKRITKFDMIQLRDDLTSLHTHHMRMAEIYNPNGQEYWQHMGRVNAYGHVIGLVEELLNRK